MWQLRLLAYKIYMPDNSSYHTRIKHERTLKLRKLTADLPPSCSDFFRGIEPTTSVLTRLGYAYDLRLFFRYLIESVWIDKNITSINDADIASIDRLMLEKFLEYITLYQSEGGKLNENDNVGKHRKLSSISSYLKYMYKSGRIPSNAAKLLDFPKRSDKPIIRLEVDEVMRMMDAVDSGTLLTEKQQKFHKLTRKRDLTIFTVLLATGIRISELVGLDMDHIDFSTNSFIVTRKGGDQVALYFGEEVETAILDYLEERKEIVPAEGHENALFLSLQKKRMSQRAIQMLVKKYASVVTPLKKISPHKFRSTFGTMLNEETGDIYLVADVLGNKDVNTTTKHYAAISDNKRRKAAGKVKLREND